MSPKVPTPANVSNRSSGNVAQTGTTENSRRVAQKQAMRSRRSSGAMPHRNRASTATANHHRMIRPVGCNKKARSEGGSPNWPRRRTGGVVHRRQGESPGVGQRIDVEAHVVDPVTPRRPEPSPHDDDADVRGQRQAPRARPAGIQEQGIGRQVGERRDPLLLGAEGRREQQRRQGRADPVALRVANDRGRSGRRRQTSWRSASCGWPASRPACRGQHRPPRIAGSRRRPASCGRRSSGSSSR